MQLMPGLLPVTHRVLLPCSDHQCECLNVRLALMLCVPAGGSSVQTVNLNHRLLALEKKIAQRTSSAGRVAISSVGGAAAGKWMLGV